MYIDSVVCISYKKMTANFVAFKHAPRMKPLGLSAECGNMGKIRLLLFITITLNN